MTLDCLLNHGQGLLGGMKMEIRSGFMVGPLLLHLRMAWTALSPALGIAQQPTLSCGCVVCSRPSAGLLLHCSAERRMKAWTYNGLQVTWQTLLQDLCLPLAVAPLVPCLVPGASLSRLAPFLGCVDGLSPESVTHTGLCLLWCLPPTWACCPS